MATTVRAVASTVGRCRRVQFTLCRAATTSQFAQDIVEHSGRSAAEPVARSATHLHWSSLETELSARKLLEERKRFSQLTRAPKHGCAALPRGNRWMMGHWSEAGQCRGVRTGSGSVLGPHA